MTKAGSSVNLLIAPLDWGLGHATRCIPIINEAIKQGSPPLICATGNTKILLEKYYPNLEYVEIPGITIRYPENNKMSVQIAKQLPGIYKSIVNEHKLLQKLIKMELCILTASILRILKFLKKWMQK